MYDSWTEDAGPDRSYHRERAREELQRARSAAGICARRAHLELARLHAEHMRSGFGDLRRDPFPDARPQAAHPTTSTQDIERDSWIRQATF